MVFIFLRIFFFARSDYLFKSKEIGFFNNCAIMLLQPRHFKYKVRQKSRRFLIARQKTSLTFGNSGLLILRPIFITGPQIFRLKLFLKRATKRSEKTYRSIWFYAFPHLPISRKPDGLRMGKGKGKLHCWFTSVTGGVVLFEFRNLRRGRSLYFFKQMTFKLGIATKFLFASRQRIAAPFSPSKQLFISSFW